MLFGAVLALLIYFGAPNFYGLRPHAVNSDLDRHNVNELLSLAENGPTTGILIYDAWYKGRAGQTGWFLMPLRKTGDTTFFVNGALDPGLAKMFGAGPRKCNGTGLPEKMVRVIEPDRDRSGFLGRSLCKRARLDVSDLIKNSLPAVRKTTDMTYTELVTFDASNNPLRLRDNVLAWPTPYAYRRTISLPLIWQRTPQGNTGDAIYKYTNAARKWARNQQQPNQVAVQLQVKNLGANYNSETSEQELTLKRSMETILLQGVQVRAIEFIVLCSSTAWEICNQIDASLLLSGALELRDPHLLGSAIKTAQKVSDEAEGQNNVLDESLLTPDHFTAPKAQERSFPVTSYEVTQ